MSRVKMQAHTMKGVAANIKALVLRNLAREIEATADADEDTGVAHVLVHKLEAVFQKIQAVLRGAVNDLP